MYFRFFYVLSHNMPTGIVEFAESVKAQFVVEKDFFNFLAGKIATGDISLEYEKNTDTDST